jgi:hypothetical protein
MLLDHPTALPFAVVVFYVVVRSSERAVRSGPTSPQGDCSWQFRLVDAGFVVLYVALAIVVAQWLALEGSLQTFSTTATIALAAVLGVWMWLLGVGLLWRAGVDRAERRLAVLLALPLGLACAVYCPGGMVMLLGATVRMVFEGQATVVPLQTGGMLLLCIFGLVAMSRLITWAARSEFVFPGAKDDSRLSGDEVRATGE